MTKNKISLFFILFITLTTIKNTLSAQQGYGKLTNEYHFSRSTHFGITIAGACGFGPYQVCSSSIKYDGEYSSLCDSFCKAYPSLCKDPEGYTFRGNFAAPQGNYYTQTWPIIDDEEYNYLSCGECFEVVRIKDDGTDYQSGEEGYQPPILLQLIDACPCGANPKWCCGAEDQCEEANFIKYGCPLPSDSIHLDLSDVAMNRLQSGKHDGERENGIIATKYRRVPCPSFGNMYIWLRKNSGPHWFSFTVVNVAGYGSIAKAEIKNDSGEWVKLIRDSPSAISRPQERYGTWVTPQGSGPFNPPVDIRLTDGAGNEVIAEGAIKSFEPPADANEDYYYIDIGVNFPEQAIPKPEN